MIYDTDYYRGQLRSGTLSPNTRLHICSSLYFVIFSLGVLYGGLSDNCCPHAHGEVVHHSVVDSRK